MPEPSESIPNETHPRVMAIFGYKNRRAPRVSKEEYLRLLTFFKDVPALNIATFIEAVQFDETERDVTMSYNLVLCPRNIDTSRKPDIEEALRIFQQRDLLVGTRDGIEGAMVWFSNLAAALKDDTEAIKTFDKIFGEAVVHLSVPAKSTSVGEMVAVTFGDKMPPGHPPDNSRH